MEENKDVEEELEVSSTSSSDESLSTGSPKGVAEENSNAPDSEAEHLAGADKGPPDEDSTADYWVVESDRVTRIHITPRYWLFTPSADSFPVPLDYIDVLRFTKTNVKGHDTLVDCWVSDSDQVPGPWIGKLLSILDFLIQSLDGLCKMVVLRE